MLEVESKVKKKKTIFKNEFQLLIDYEKIDFKKLAWTFNKTIKYIF